MTSEVPRYWRGPDYKRNPFALRMLILGESHHGEDRGIECTEKVILERIEGFEHGRFFKVVEHIILGRRPLVHEVRDIWNSVSFMNYAPHIVAEGRGASLHHFEGARPRFVEAVRELRPELICMFSREAWNNRPVPVSLHGEMPSEVILSILTTDTPCTVTRARKH